MLHSLLMNYQAEFDGIKLTLRHENFDHLKSLLLRRTRAIENENSDDLQLAYVDLMQEIKKLNLMATRHYKFYMKNRAALIKKLDVERKTVAGEPMLASYVESLDNLKKDILHFDAEIDVNFLKKLEETLQLEKAGFSQRSLFSFFHASNQPQNVENAVYQTAGVKQ